MDKRVRILCVGIGGYADIYLEELLSDKDSSYEIAGMVEIAPDTCKYYPELKSRGVPLYTAVEEFFADNTADLAIITTPIHLHKRQILCALRHGANVMCEKPLSGVSADESEIAAEMEKSGKFVIIGYQWSYSRAIQSLKRDILKGMYGNPEFLKGLVLWPRSRSYFTRGSGWAGKIQSRDGTVINDSVVNNAAAHYIHNMLYITGGTKETSSEAVSVTGDLLRANKIENFDSAVVRFSLDNGAGGIFVASHATVECVNPIFEYRFSGGCISFNSDDNIIAGKLNSGEIIRYGNPFENVNKKIFDAINAVGKSDYTPPCGVAAAAAQVRFVEKLQKQPIYSFKESSLDCENQQVYVKGLDRLLLRCYKEEKLLSEYPEYVDMVKDNK